MRKRFGSGACIHCGVHTDKLTGDHVFPESWYPDSTPEGLEKWQAPACEQCNHEFGKLEKRLFRQLAMGVEPWTVGAEGIADRAIRSFDPEAAKNDADRKHREAARERVRRSLRTIAMVPETPALLPNIGTLHLSDSNAIEVVAGSDLTLFMKKVVRGFSYLATGQVLPAEYVIRLIPTDKYAQIPNALLDSPATIFERGPGLRVERHYSSDDPYAALFRIQFWGRYEFIATVWLAALEAASTPAG